MEVISPGLRFEEHAQDVEYLGRPAGLTPCEFRLLHTLQRHADTVLGKAFLYRHVLLRDHSRHDRSLDMHVSRIRRKLKAIGYPAQKLRTVWGKGYVFTTVISLWEEENSAVDCPTSVHTAAAY